MFSIIQKIITTLSAISRFKKGNVSVPKRYTSQGNIYTTGPKESYIEYVDVEGDIAIYQLAILHFRGDVVARIVCDNMSREKVHQWAKEKLNLHKASLNKGHLTKNTVVTI